MKSPTSSIMHSIQALKSKLRSDHLQLQGLRRDFAMGPARPLYEIQQRQESPILNLQNFHSNHNKSNNSLQKYTRNKIIQLRKNHQNQTKILKQHHLKQKGELQQFYQSKIQEITKVFQDKIKEQESYILLLQEQMDRERQQQQDKFKDLLSINSNRSLKMSHCPKIYDLNCTEMTFVNKIHFKVFENERNTETIQINQESNSEVCENNEKKGFKYQKIVNNLLMENAQLLQTVERLKMQNRKLLHDTIENSQKETQKRQLQQNLKKIHHDDIKQSSRDSNSFETEYFSMRPISLSNNIKQSSHHNGLVKRDRLKFSKASDRVKSHTERSFFSINNENIDTSNIMCRNANSIQKQDQQSVIQNSIVQEEQQSILSEEMKIKTIKHFMKIISHRSTEPQQTILQPIFRPSLPVKRGGGIRNALRCVSALQNN